MKPVSVPKIIKIKIPIIILKTPIFAEKAMIVEDFKLKYIFEKKYLNEVTFLIYERKELTQDGYFVLSNFFMIFVTAKEKASSI